MSTKKLSALINYRDQLEAASALTVHAASAHTAAKVEQACADTNWNMQAVSEAVGIIDQAARDLDRALVNLLQTADLEIKHAEHDYLVKSYMLYDASNKSPEQVITERASTYSAEMTRELTSTIESLANWNTPGLEIGPGQATWTELMVSCDPLYLVDIEPSFLYHTVQHFEPAYQRRLRTYVTDECSLIMLPQAQIGLAVAINVFEYLPYEIVKNYLQQVFNVLRPGGKFVFTYNNCEQYGSCQLVENEFKCYMTRRRLQMIADGLGYTIEKHVDFYPNSTYAVLARPGKLTSNRGSQMLAKIIN